MGTTRENTAVTGATSRNGSAQPRCPIAKERFEAEKSYRVAMAVIDCMLATGIISVEDKRAIDTILGSTFCPISSDLYR